MSFGLKNARATYQRMMDKVFQSQIGRNIEVYVNDMVVKTKRDKSHIDDLRETYQTLTKYGLKLNPTKCFFGVHFGKFLAFMMTERGIEANPKKISALLHMVEPRCIKDVQRLNRCVAALGRFISKSAERSLPFFKVLKQAARSSVWNEECKREWEKIKQYLQSPPLLSSPVLGEILYIDLVVSNLVVASALIREVENKQLLVYDVSKVLNRSESKYSNIEKLASSCCCCS